MGKAARAIVIEGDKILVMQRIKYGVEYYTLVGGRLAEGESLEQALVREIMEETGLTVTAASLVFIEEHPEPYNEQYIFLCNVGPHDDSIDVQGNSEEGQMNRFGANLHRPFWAQLKAFDRLPFRTPQLQQAILNGIKKGFPKAPVKL
jgi:ADP-ribose pyrophosphatase YjhB (NUDIX family)